jgi:hypothetical protein
LKAYLCEAVERRIILDEFSRLPEPGAVMAANGRRYKVTAVHAAQRPPVLVPEPYRLSAVA